ncbi:PIG-L family deacetylase [Cellulomonas soli]|uniref:1D-myo-inositol 2-acetamido-2-deoxy-alpha-D-glucopyranoside deacetylase n=1 Tax=Cellulomonas soli TaxID=931535 RepID=A0A512PFT9_9CELL|nr:PIG-L family deacetylase [Cellulomonas soli]NYI59792.1 N-acetyl-1-D-myo-inositol-2-amino-2-deoxy-alpha-D-glucopyranoside deacetylase [Cellulomonas soli]GEP70065.1 1D-myo-inositol 2-acetamido-2-deoxy-alpha-D-glucopyranoside deacetylase [Cellulomonas soli]
MAPSTSVPPAGGLLAVHAHPDDETLATGALLATWAAAGRPVTVVTCTRGERGEVIGSALAHLEGDGAALAAHREGELAAALRALGVDDHVFLDTVPDGAGASAVPARFEDSGMAWVGTGRAGTAAHVPPRAFVAAHPGDVAHRLARVLRSRRPEVVVTYERDGGYGHPDHVRAHEVTVRAVALAAAEPDSDNPPHVVPVVLWAAHDEMLLRAAYGALAGPEVAAVLDVGERTLERPDPDGPLPSVAVPPDWVDLLVDVAPVLPQVLGALRAHATQVQAVHAVDEVDALVGLYALSNDVLAPLLPVEGYRCGLAHGRPAPESSLGSATLGVTWPVGVRPVA